MTLESQLNDTLGSCKVTLDKLHRAHGLDIQTEWLYRSFGKQHDYLLGKLHKFDDQPDEVVAIMATSACTLLFQIHSEYQRVFE